MSHQKKCTTKTKENQHLTYEDRQKIEYDYNNGTNPAEIAVKLREGKFHRTTIEREIKLGLYEHTDFNSKTHDGIVLKYSADIAQSVRDFRSSGKGPGLKIDEFPEQAKELEKLIKSGYSPYAAIVKLGLDISVKTIYNYLDKNIFETISNDDLLCKKHDKKRGYHKVERKAHNNLKGKSISERPLAANSRLESGHWEIDLVVGKKGTKPVLLTLDDRKSRLKLAIKLPNKEKNSVLEALKRLRKKYKFKTITADNGPEFLGWEDIEKRLDTKVFYAHPYSSWERGTNEVGNKFIRRFFPKGTDFSRVSQKRIDKVMDFINNYPRKILDGMSANEVMAA